MLGSLAFLGLRLGVLSAEISLLADILGDVAFLRFGFSLHLELEALEAHFEFFELGRFWAAVN